MAELSPMMKQYVETKEKYQDSILFFRLGDFYEMFFEDAKIASEELDLVLTGKDCGREERAPMCGIPYHSSEGYISRLIEKGYKVAICEQTEDPSKAKGLVKRDVVRIITPGTVIENDMLDEGRNSYLAAIVLNPDDIGLCFTDASTGESYATSVKGDGTQYRTVNELARFNPKEVLVSSNIERYKDIKEYLDNSFEGTVTVREKGSFDIAKTGPLLLKHFKAVSSENYGIESGSSAEAACGAIIEYLYETGVSGNIAVNKVSYYTENQFMRLDITAIRNLEICETMRSKAKKGSLLWVIDKTKTAMGKRLVRGWIEKPLLSINDINYRQNAVEELCSDTILRCEATEYLSGVRDVERLITKTLYGSVKANELLQISQTASRFPLIKKLLETAKCKMLRSIYEDIDPLEDIASLIDNSINPNAPSALKEGGLIKDGYNEEVDELRSIMKNGTGYITAMEATEKERTGIKNLRIKYNKVFGYYIEVTNSFLERVPEDYIRKQTLKNCERFITPELKQFESKVLSAKDRLTQLEYEIFCDIRNKTAEAIERFQITAAAVARLDVLCSFAAVAV
ncbi:MAG: DNA mismatch repair protein MutS, partial [Clostridia bacterium]|nr:DNA mismatch repair protein MutS [Clostridia bacterium]